MFNKKKKTKHFSDEIREVKKDEFSIPSTTF